MNYSDTFERDASENINDAVKAGREGNADAAMVLLYAAQAQALVAAVEELRAIRIALTKH